MMRWKALFAELLGLSVALAACDGSVSVATDPSGRADPNHPGATVIIGVNEQDSEPGQPR